MKFILELLSVVAVSISAVASKKPSILTSAVVVKSIGDEEEKKNFVLLVKKAGHQNNNKPFVLPSLKGKFNENLFDGLWEKYFGEKEAEEITINEESVEKHEDKESVDSREHQDENVALFYANEAELDEEEKDEIKIWVNWLDVLEKKSKVEFYRMNKEQKMKVQYKNVLNKNILNISDDEDVEDIIVDQEEEGKNIFVCFDDFQDKKKIKKIRTVNVATSVRTTMKWSDLMDESSTYVNTFQNTVAGNFKGTFFSLDDIRRDVKFVRTFPFVEASGLFMNASGIRVNPKMIEKIPEFDASLASISPFYAKKDTVVPEDTKINGEKVKAGNYEQNPFAEMAVTDLVEGEDGKKEKETKKKEKKDKKSELKKKNKSRGGKNNGGKVVETKHTTTTTTTKPTEASITDANKPATPELPVQPVVESETNWTLIGGIIVIAVIVIVAAIFLVKKNFSS